MPYFVKQTRSSTCMDYNGDQSHFTCSQTCMRKYDFQIKLLMYFLIIFKCFMLTFTCICTAKHINLNYIFVK